jgi:peptidyl-tRNA hydrolase
VLGPQNESARGSKSLKAKNERGSFYRLRVGVGVGEMNFIDSILMPELIGVKFFLKIFNRIGF